MVGAPGEGLRGAERRGGAGRLGGPGGGVGWGGRDPGAGRRGLGPAWEKSPLETWACDPRLGFARCPQWSKRSGPARSRAPRSAQSPRSLASSSAASDPGASLAAMAAAAGLRALGAKESGWLRRGPWPPLTAGLCSGGPAGVGRPEPGSRPTSTRLRDGIRSAARGRAGLFPGRVAGGTREERGAEEAGPPTAPPHAEYSEAPSVVSSARHGAQFIHHSGSVRRRGPTWRKSADAAFTDVPCLGPVAFATLQDAHGGFKWGYLGGFQHCL